MGSNGGGASAVAPGTVPAALPTGSLGEVIAPAKMKAPEEVFPANFTLFEKNFVLDPNSSAAPYPAIGPCHAKYTCEGCEITFKKTKVEGFRIGEVHLHDIEKKTEAVIEVRGTENRPALTIVQMKVDGVEVKYIDGRAYLPCDNDVGAKDLFHDELKGKAAKSHRMSETKSMLDKRLAEIGRIFTELFTQSQNE